MFRRLLTSLFGRSAAPLKSNKRRKNEFRPAFSMEALEERCVLTSTLYIDFGDAFGAGVLTGTMGALRDSVAPGSTVNVNGPDIPNLTTGQYYSDTTTFTMSSFNSVYGAQATAMRSTIMQLVRRYYEPFDITVVELTASNQSVNGFNVRGAANLNDVSLTMNLNEGAAKNNDTYIFVAEMFIGAGRYNPGLDGLVGIADGDDLSVRANMRDDTGVVTLAGTFWSTDLLATTIAHEAGHNFGLRHTFGNSPSSAPGFSTALYESDLMSYLSDGFGGLGVFSRYPLAIGDGNLNPNLLSATPTPYDQMVNDSQIGAANVSYITGTGAYDIITVTRQTATTAQVTVQAFTTAGFTGAITVPGTATTTYSYSISTTNTLLIDAGVRSDRILIDATLGQQVLVRGMGGITGNGNDADELVIFGTAATAVYTPGTNAALGLDGHTDYRGTITIGSTIVRFQEFDLGSSISFSGITNVTVQTPLGSDNITIDTITFNGNLNQRVAGVTGGVFIVPLYFRNATSFTLDSATADALGGDDVVLVNAWLATLLNSVILNTGNGNDSIVIASSGASALTGVTVDSGAGNDFVTVNAWSPSQTSLILNLGTEDDVATINAPFIGTAMSTLTVVGDDGDDTLAVSMNSFLMTGGNLISYNGGAGADTIRVSNDVATTTLSNNLVTSSGGGTIPLTSVENAVLSGGASANSFLLSNWNGTSAVITGGAGIDNLTIQQGTVATATYNPSNSSTNGLSGSITLPALAIAFSEFDATSMMSLQDVTTLTIQTLGGADVLAIDSPSAGRNRVTGTTAGVIVAPLQFFNLTSLIIDTGNGDGATGDDGVTLGSLVATGLQNVSVSTGSGNDSFNVGTTFVGTTIRNVILSAGDGDDSLALTLDNFALPVAGGVFSFAGGIGTDTINLTNNVTTTTLTSTSLASSNGGTLTHSGLEIGNLTGGAGNNVFVVSSWTGSSLALSGGAGTDTFTLGSGNIESVTGDVAINAGSGASDSLILNDNGNAAVADYTIGATTVTTVLATGVARVFGTLTFDSALESITLNATSGANTVFVTPSITTTMSINGNNPTSGTPADRLQVDFVGTGNRTLTNVGGNGSWTFPGSGTPLFGVRSPINFTGFEKVNNELAFGSAGSDPGATSAPWVKFVDLVSGEIVEFLAYEESFRGGVSVITADVTGDGVVEIITAPGRGRAPEIRVFTRFGTELTAFRTMAFASTDMNGVNLAVADVNGDLRNDIIAVRGRGVTEVRVFRNDFGVNADPIADDAIYRFNAFPTTFIGGASVTAGDFNADGRAEIVVGSGSGQAAVVVVFDPTTLPLIAPAAATPATPPIAFAKYSNFFDPSFLGGISSMSVGRINGDATRDIVVGQGQGGNSMVAMLDGTSGRWSGGTYMPTVEAATQFSAYSDTGNRAAIYVAARDSDGDGVADMIFTGQASDGRTRGVIRVFRPLSPLPPGSVPLFGEIEFAGITVG